MEFGIRSLLTQVPWRIKGKSSVGKRCKINRVAAAGAVRYKRGEGTAGCRSRKGTLLQIFMPWLHIFSFSIWLGANLFVLSMLWPASRSLPAAERVKAMRRNARGLNAVAATAAPLAVLSGLGGFLPGGTAAQLAAGSGYLFVLTAKGVLTAVMALNHGLQAFRYHGSVEDPLDARNPWMRLLAANAVLGIVVLLLGLALRRVAM